MFCYTVACSIQCVIQELRLWSKISSEHPVFLLNVARMSNKRLSKSTVDKLKEANKAFEEVHKCATGFSGVPQDGSTPVNITDCMRDFLKVDKAFIQTLNELKQYGKKDRVWQALVEHIEQEQRYMYRLMETLLMQISM